MSGGTSVLFQSVIFVPLQYHELLTLSCGPFSPRLHFLETTSISTHAFQRPCFLLPLFPTCHVFTAFATSSCYLIFSLKLSDKHTHTHACMHTHTPCVLRLSISNRLTGLWQEMLLDLLAAPWCCRACPTRIFQRLLAPSNLAPPLKSCVCFTRHPLTE